MKHLLHASLKTRLIWATAVSAVIVVGIAALIVLFATGEWKKAQADANSWYSGGEKQRCEALFAGNPVDSSEPNCRRRFTPHAGAKTYEEMLDEIGIPQEDADCIAHHNLMRLLAIEKLKQSGCPIYGYTLGDSLYAPPILRPPKMPPPIWDFALARSNVRPLGLATFFLALTAYLMLAMATVRIIANEPHLGWKRLTIVAGVVCPPLAVYVAYFEYRADEVEQFGVFLLTILVVPVGITAVRKLFFWVYSGFVESGAQRSSSTQAMRDPSAPESFGDAVKPLGKTFATSPSMVVGHEPIDDDALREALLAMPLASPWRRFFARTIDLWFFAYPVGAIGGIFFGHQIAEHPYLAGVFLLPFLLVLEAGTATVFGNSIGKALLAVRVTTLRGGMPSFSQHFERLRKLYVFGLAFGIPFISLFPMIKQYQLLNSARPTSYDMGEFTVRASTIGGGRKVLAAVVLFVLMSIPGLMNATFR